MGELMAWRGVGPAITVAGVVTYVEARDRRSADDAEDANSTKEWVHEPGVSNEQRVIKVAHRRALRLSVLPCAAQNDVVSWFSSVRKICYCTSPKGYWCTRTDRHAVHEAAGGHGQVYSRWRGDFPNERELIETFSSAETFRKAIGAGTGDALSHKDHNDLIRGLR
jgi:hypothetical protein